MALFSFLRKNKSYSLAKSHRILMHSYKLYKKKGGKLSKDNLKSLESRLQLLDEACLKKDRESADQHARWVEDFCNQHLKKSFFDYTKEFAGALIFALAIATIVRQSWFEIYEIPTGSMRPTFKEQDDLTVSKTSYGLNIPLKTDHFLFYPDKVQRASVIIFTGDGIDLPDTDTTYFGLFPAKKRYTKRMIGKPGDILYFYGGLIYGIDKEGNPIDELNQSEWMKKIEHIPFLSFEGKPSATQNEIVFKHMNEPIGRLSISSKEGFVGEIYKEGSWVKENLKGDKTKGPTAFSDFYGINNFAKARLLNKSELLERYPDSKLANDGILFLDLAHTPSLTYPKPKITQQDLSFNLVLTPERSVIPLKKEHLDALFENMYTARFVVKNQTAKRYSLENDRFSPINPKMKGVADGTYEFYFGKAHNIGFWGISRDVPKSSALYNNDPASIQLLFNLGIDFVNFYEPNNGVDRLFPNRYAYFRDGDLYLLGAPILKKDDPVLKEFVKSELDKESKGTKDKPYFAFVDKGAPLKEGQLDREFIRRFGLKVPDRYYFVLGDNHAMSADSRIFGFVPEQNLQGAPSLLIWPPGDRFGLPYQKPYPFLSIPRLIVWSIAAIVGLIYWIYVRMRRTKPVFHKIEFKS